MRRLLIVGVVMLGAFTPTVRAQQDVAPPLQRVIYSGFEIPLPLTFCDVPAAIAGLAKRLGLVAGIEYLPGDCQAEWRRVKRSNALGMPTKHYPYKPDGNR